MKYALQYLRNNNTNNKQQKKLQKKVIKTNKYAQKRQTDTRCKSLFQI